MKRLFIITILALSLCLPALAFDPYFFNSGLQKEWSFNAQQNNPLDARGKQGGDGTFTFAGTNRTYIDADGVMQTAGANTPVYEIVGGKKALRLEPAGANILLDTRNIDDASTYWTEENTGTAAQNVTGVDSGANKATTITDSDGASYYNLYQELSKSTLDTNPFCYSVFVKKTTGATTFPGIGIKFRAVATKTVYYAINTNLGTITAHSGNNAANMSASIRDTGGDFWRVWVTATDNGANNIVRLLCYPAANADASATWAGATQGSAIFDCAQLEANKKFPSSYVDGAAATLGADIATDGDCSGGTLATGAGWAHDAGNNEYDATASDANLTDAGILTANKVYRLKVVFANDGGGSFIPILGGASGTAIDANGTYYQYIIAGGTDLVFDATALTGSIQSYEVKEHGTVRLTEASALSFTLPSGVFDASGTVICWFATGFDEENVSLDTCILAVRTTTYQSLLYHYAAGNGMRTYDGTAGHANTDIALAFDKHTWYKAAVVWPSDTLKYKMGVDSGSGITYGTEDDFAGSYDTTGTKLWFGYDLLQGPIYISKVVIFDKVLTAAQINAIGGSP